MVFNALAATPDLREQWREVGRLVVTGLAWMLYAAGFTLARGLRAAGTAVGAVFIGVGWLAGRVVWPAMCWCGRASRVGWDAGRKPVGRA
jgi:hypothetical protein